MTRRAKTEGWNLFTTGFDTPIDPSLIPWLSCAAQWAGRWCNTQVDALMADFQKTMDIDARARIWQQVQALVWQDAYANKLCDEFTFHAFTSKLKGYVDSFDCYLWNCRLES